MKVIRPSGSAGRILALGRLAAPHAAWLVASLTLLAVPLAAQPHSPPKGPRVGVMLGGSSTDPFLAAFRQGLRELGYTEGHGIAIEARHANGALDRDPKLVAELIGLKVDILLVWGTQVAARSAMTQTRTVPIVFVQAGDPVGSGLVTSLARPGGNVTGLSNLVSELSGKQLELLEGGGASGSPASLSSTIPSLGLPQHPPRWMGRARPPGRCQWSCMLWRYVSRATWRPPFPRWPRGVRVPSWRSPIRCSAASSPFLRSWQ